MRIYLIGVLLLSVFKLHSSIDLESCSDDYVLETKQIFLPLFPDAFNPSIIKISDRLLMTFRIIPDPKNYFTSKLGYVWLDDEFTPISIPKLLQLHPEGTPSRAEDARLILVRDELFMVYSDNIDQIITKGGFRVHLAKLQIDGDTLITEHTEALKDFPGESILIREKNWTPFVFENELLLAYSHIPHVVFSPILRTEKCVPCATSHNPIHWDWGVLRGGTPALPINDHQYLSFFHSCQRMETIHSHPKAMLHYFMGAYLFSSKYPFAITHVSPKPIIAPGFYSGPNYKPYWHSMRGVFPGGLLFDDTYIWVAYGKLDHEMWVAKMDKKRLLESLVPVKPLEINTSTKKKKLPLSQITPS